MFIDTSGLLCLLDKSEHSHPEAAGLYRNSGHRLTHNYVLAEFVALTIRRRVPRARSLEFITKLMESGKVEVTWVNISLHRAATALLQSRLDKQWSLCDAVSFVLMRRRGETEALTTDHDFEQAGFVRLLAP